MKLIYWTKEIDFEIETCLVVYDIFERYGRGRGLEETRRKLKNLMGQTQFYFWYCGRRQN